LTKEEMIQNLGRIGHSGSGEFIKSIEKGKDANIIGQFGGLLKSNKKKKTSKLIYFFIFHI